MPLVRVEVRNEYGLGQPELYREVNREDPKAVLDGVAVAGLVGILRQLGDLAEFAAEIFLGLQEQVMTTASRSHKLMVRVQHTEAALSPLEKAVLAQTSHIHFAYTAGSDWHARIQNEQNHFIYNDLPRFIMDNYEECRDPPRLHLLDKFDIGGPGSCLKRYSDPTFFKRVSATCDEVNAEKAQRDKKARKAKKKRSSQSGEVSNGASIFNRSGRMQFASTNGQTSPPQTTSSFDMTLKSDMRDKSNSFDSRTGSGFIECVFHLNSSMHPEEEEPVELSSSSLKMQHSDSFDEQNIVVDDDFPDPSLQEQTVPRSSCVTWDEKTEVVEATGEQLDSSKYHELLSTNSDLVQGKDFADLDNCNQVDILNESENNRKSISSSNQLDEIESETDNYMDALNTIESESENDFDCQTKRELEQCSSSFDNDIAEAGMHEHVTDYSDHCASNFESHITSHNSSNQGTSYDLPNSVSSEHELSPENVGRSSNTASSPVTDINGRVDIPGDSKLEYVVNDPSSSGSGMPNPPTPIGEKIISSFCESQESLERVSGVQSVKFWTNGGLLGLEPSKPPCSVLNVASIESLAKVKDDVVGTKIHTDMLSSHGDGREIVMLNENFESIERHPRSKCPVRCHNDQDGISPKKNLGVPPTDLVERYSDSHNCNTVNHTHGRGMNEPSEVMPKIELPGAPNVGVTSTEANKSDENSFRIFGFSQRLLASGFRRKLSLVDDEKSESPGSKHDAAYQTSSRAIFDNQFGVGSLLDSPSASPPLEQMKISFHPTNDFETSKLKLKFPDGSDCLETVRDAFPSFQLVPEPAAPLQDIGSDSDDNTFCRSSPCMSDDCLSHLSEYNTEHWESGETVRSNDHQIYGALCRISSVESISNSVELEGTTNGSIQVDHGLKSIYSRNGVEPSNSSPLLDLPSFDAVNALLQQEAKNDSDLKELLRSQNPKESANSAPLPPPLPPAQWQVLKPHSDVAEGIQDALSETSNNAFDLKLLETTIPRQPTPVPAMQQNVDKVVESIPKNKQDQQKLNGQKEANEALNGKQDQQKLNGQKEANEALNGKVMDEREDFLRQIRTKSFNLRRTVTARPTFTPHPTTNVKVTAILEKANAIRQAVGSDDGEDDNWSDT